MVKHGKKYNKAHEGIERGTVRSLNEALARLKEVAYASFDESVDVSVNMGIDPLKGDQVIRGAVTLPQGTGKVVKVIVFAKGEHAEAAEKAGADYVGADDLIEKIEGGWLDFNYAVATPDLMGAVGRLAKILGPRGLLPNKKVGTVTFDVGSIVKDLKKGRSFFKSDKGGIVHFSLGKVSFDADKLRDNFVAFIKSLISARPASVKGQYIKKITLSSTMGPGLGVSADEILKL
ncbi:MAG: 50S ribosomal protein L1 [Candidatus Babeliales bacterium]